MVNIFYSFVNPLEDWLSSEWFESISIEKTKYDFMREIAEDIEFEEIETVHEDRKIETTVQIIV